MQEDGRVLCLHSKSSYTTSMQCKDSGEKGGGGKHPGRVDTCWCSVRCEPRMRCPGRHTLETSASPAIWQTETAAVRNISVLFKSKSLLLWLPHCCPAALISILCVTTHIPKVLLFYEFLSPLLFCLLFLPVELMYAINARWTYIGIQHHLGTN